MKQLTAYASDEFLDAPSLLENGVIHKGDLAWLPFWNQASLQPEFKHRLISSALIGARCCHSSVEPIDMASLYLTLASELFLRTAFHNQLPTIT